MKEAEKIIRKITKIDDFVKSESKEEDQFLESLENDLKILIKDLNVANNDEEKTQLLKAYVDDIDSKNLLKSIKSTHKKSNLQLEHLIDKFIKFHDNCYSWLHASNKDKTEEQIKEEAEERKVILQLIGKYLIRNNEISGYESLLKEANLDKISFQSDIEKYEKFIILKNILIDIDSKSFQSIEDWISSQKQEDLESIKYKLNFINLNYLVHKLKFLNLALSEPNKAFEYARNNFNKNKKNKKEIKNLLELILFKNEQQQEKDQINELENEQKELIIKFEECLTEFKETFIEIYCKINLILKKSLLETIIETALNGITDLDKLLKMEYKKKPRKKLTSNELNDLLQHPLQAYSAERNSSDESSSCYSEPTSYSTSEDAKELDSDNENKMEVDKDENEKNEEEERSFHWRDLKELPPWDNVAAGCQKYHSVFVCPISKEESTEDNPPMMLTCGHVISKESLISSRSPSRTIKCPTCPKEQDPADVLQLYF